MRFGICLECDTELGPFADCVQTLEDQGFDYLWLTDLGLNAFDVFPFMTVALTRTSCLRIGAAVHPPQLRHPAVTLNALVTLDHLSEGRVACGFGTGADGLLRPIGRRSLKLDSLRELVDASRRLMAGESVSTPTPGLEMHEARLRRPPARSLPIYLAATGPKTLALAGEVADGVIAHVGAATQTIRAALGSCGHGQQARSSSRSFDFTPYLYASVAGRREEALAACAAGARTVAFRAPHLARAAGCTAEQETRLRGKEADTEDIFSEQLVDQLTLSGTVSDCVRKLEAISALGVDHVTLYPRGADIGAVTGVFAREILPRFQ